MEIQKRELENLLKRQAKEAAEEVEDRTKRHLGVLQEDFEHKVDAVIEAVEDIPNIKRKVDLTFDKVGGIAVDLEVVKKMVKEHERELQVR